MAMMWQALLSSTILMSVLISSQSAYDDLFDDFSVMLDDMQPHKKRDEEHEISGETQPHTLESRRAMTNHKHSSLPRPFSTRPPKVFRAQEQQHSGTNNYPPIRPFFLFASTDTVKQEGFFQRGASKKNLKGYDDREDSVEVGNGETYEEIHEGTGDGLGGELIEVEEVAKAPDTGTSKRFKTKTESQGPETRKNPNTPGTTEISMRMRSPGSRKEDM